MNEIHLKPMNQRSTVASLFLGFAVWFLHLNSMYFLTSESCKWGWFPYSIAGLPGVSFVQLVVTTIAAMLTLRMIYLAWRNWRQFQINGDHVLEQTMRDRRPLIAAVAMSLNMLFLLFVLAFLVVLLTLNTCG
jgi:multisubunit Na+/H+ antiporter MnhB subunit